MNRRPILLSLAAFAAVVAVAAAVALVATRPALSPTAASPKPAPVPVVEASSWGESHSVIQMAAPPSSGPRDTMLASLALAELPPPIVEHGATIRMRVAVPDWMVFDKDGKVNPHADGVVLVVVNPDVGIGLELGRLELNPHDRPADRGWHVLSIEVPPCVGRLALEARAGTGLDANNAYDQLLIHVSEALDFRKGGVRGRLRSGPTGCPAGGCVPKALARKCGSEQPASAAARVPVGALRTGTGRLSAAQR